MNDSIRLDLLLEIPDKEGCAVYAEVVSALFDYSARIMVNNSFDEGRICNDRIDNVGCTVGPNRFIAKNGVVITERIEKVHQDGENRAFGQPGRTA